ncbi:MAG TPA: transposase [Gemmatimonadales bacterium]|nr:transposase [Gemmatimonadales bacterium]
MIFGREASVVLSPKDVTPGRRPGVVSVVTEVILEAARRCRVRVHAQAVLADHVHVLVSYPPDTTLSSFIRHAKCPGL